MTLRQISPRIIRYFSSVNKENFTKTLPRVNDELQEFKNGQKNEHLAIVIRITELERSIIDLQSDLNRLVKDKKYEIEEHEKPLFRFQRKSYSSKDPNDDKGKYEVDFTITNGKIVGGILVLMFGYGAFVKSD